MSGIAAILNLGGFSPTQISGIELWFDGSNSASITSSGGSVSQWNDLSGNNNNLTQPTVLNQPVIQAAAQNGLNTLLFVIANSTEMILTSPIPAGNNFSEFFVSRLGGTTMVWAGNLGTSGACPQVTTSSNTLFVTNNDGSFSNSGATFSDTTSYHLYEGFSSGTNASDSLFYDRASVPLSAGGGAGTITITSLTGFGRTQQSGFCGADIAEYIRYGVVLTNAQRLQVENYLHNKWGTA